MMDENSAGCASEGAVKHMVNRFLMWKLPEDFHPDAGISFTPDFNVGTKWPMKHEPSGTNLLHYGQAEAMVRHMLEGLPAPTISQDVESAVDYSKLFRSREWATIRDTLVPLWPRSAVGDACDPNSAATAIETALSTISQDVPAPAAVVSNRERARDWCIDNGVGSTAGRSAVMRFAEDLDAALSAATPLQSDLAAENARLRKAIKATEYKYFGDYEMSADQRAGVDTLVEFASRHLARAALQGADNHE